MNVIAVVVPNAAIARQPAVAFQNYQNMHITVCSFCILSIHQHQHQQQLCSVLYILHAIYCIVSMNFSTRIKHFGAKARCREGWQRQKR